MKRGLFLKLAALSPLQLIGMAPVYNNQPILTYSEKLKKLFGDNMVHFDSLDRRDFDFKGQITIHKSAACGPTESIENYNAFVDKFYKNYVAASGLPEKL